MTSRTQLEGFSKAFTKALFITLALSGTALGATSRTGECDRVARNLRSLEVSVNALSTDTIDTNSVTASSKSEYLDDEPVEAEAVAPILYLTPRVVEILHDVFGSSSDLSFVVDQEIAAPSSPLASETDSETTRGDATDADTESVDEDADIPHFQRQMFRTDI